MQNIGTRNEQTDRQLDSALLPVKSLIISELSLLQAP